MRWAGGSGRSVSSPLARREWCHQLGQWSPLKISDIMLGAYHRSLNLRKGCRALLTLALETGAGHTVNKILPCCPGILLMQQWGVAAPHLQQAVPLGTLLHGHWVFAALGTCVHHLQWTV